MVSRKGPSDTSRVDSFRRRLVEEATRIGRPLSEAEAAGLASHHRLLLEWSRALNLTGLRDDATILKRHFLEPLAAADLFDRPGTLVDLGSGNGFPAIPLAILNPGLRLILVESSEKKSAFLWAVLRELGLRGSRVETRRATRRADIADLLPCTYLTYRAIRLAELIEDEGVNIIEAGGKAVFFVALEKARELRHRRIAGLRFIGIRALPWNPRACLVVFESSAPKA